jgi:hypothetical protein
VSKIFKILSIDGGGIKGLYSATILAEFEEKYKCQISDHFDMLCGTSTGGLIALALSLKIPAKEICDFYVNQGPKIFPSFKKMKLGRATISRGTYKQLMSGGKFSDRPLKEALTKVFGENKMADSNNLLCIPSYTITEARPIVFKYDHKEGNLDRDNGAKMIDIALATSAAPTYFPMAEIPYYNNKQFIDGGVWGNNPTLIGLLEALDYFVGNGKEFSELKILSISSLSLTGGKPVGLKRNRSFLDWRDELFETSLTGQSYFSHFFMSKIKLLSDIKIDYVRVPTAEVSSQQEDLIQLDVATKPALDLMIGKGRDMADLYKKKAEVAEFFKDKKEYTINH